MASGSEVASVYVRIGADLSGLSTGLAQAGAGVDTMKGALGALALGAAGFVASQAVSEVKQFFKDLAADAWSAVAAQERLGLSAQALAASEAMAADPTLTMADALDIAGGRAQALLEFINQLALSSPYSTEMIGQTVRQSMLYGVQSEQAMALTQALVDYAAAAGLSNDELGRLGVAFGQLSGKGKLMGEEMRQFTNAGFGVSSIAQIMGMDVGEVATAMKKGEISAQELIAGFIEFSSLRFGGRAEDMAGSFAGMAETLQDVKDMGLRKVFGEFNAETGETGGLMGALQPVMQEFMDTMKDPEFLSSLTRLGEVFTASFADTIDSLATTLPMVVTALSGLAPAMAALAAPTFGTAVGYLVDMAGTAAGLGALATNLGRLVSMVVDPMGKMKDNFGGFLEALKIITVVGNPAMLFFKLMADQLERTNKAFEKYFEWRAKLRGEEVGAEGAGTATGAAAEQGGEISWWDKILQGVGLQDKTVPITAALSPDLAAVEAEGEAMGAAARRGYDRGFGGTGTTNIDLIQELRSRGSW